MNGKSKTMGIFLIITFFVSLISFVWGTTLAIRGGRGDGIATASVGGGIVSLVVAVTILVSYSSNINGVESRRVFYQTNNANDQFALSMSIDELSEYRSEYEIRRYRDRANEFNVGLARNRAWCSGLILWPLLPCLGDEVKPLSLATISGKK